MSKKNNQPRNTQKIDKLTENLRANLIRRKKAKNTSAKKEN